MLCNWYEVVKNSSQENRGKDDDHYYDKRCMEISLKILMKFRGIALLMKKKPDVDYFCLDVLLFLTCLNIK